MTSKLKCPVCGKTELIRMFNPLTGKYFEDYDCPFRLCNFRGNKVAVDALTQAKQDLEIARKALKVYSSDSGNWWYGYEFHGHYEDYAGEYADEALEQIDHKE